MHPLRRPGVARHSSPTSCRERTRVLDDEVPADPPCSRTVMAAMVTEFDMIPGTGIPGHLLVVFTVAMEQGLLCPSGTPPSRAGAKERVALAAGTGAATVYPS